MIAVSVREEVVVFGGPGAVVVVELLQIARGRGVEQVDFAAHHLLGMDNCLHLHFKIAGWVTLALAGLYHLSDF